LNSNNTDPEKGFTFTVTFSSDDELLLDMLTEDGIPGAVYDEKSGVWTWTGTLKGGESKIFEEIPEGVKYKVEEADYTNEGYTTTKPENAEGSIGDAQPEVVFTNTRLVGSLEVSKKLAGNNTSTADEFGFKVVFTGSETELGFITASGGALGAVSENGGVWTCTWTGKLKGGSVDNKVTFSNIPEGVKYEVFETDSKGYTPTVPGNASGIIAVKTKTEVVFTNTRNTIIIIITTAPTSATTASTGTTTVTGTTSTSGTGTTSGTVTTSTTATSTTATGTTSGTTSAVVTTSDTGTTATTVITATTSGTGTTTSAATTTGTTAPMPTTAAADDGTANLRIRKVLTDEAGVEIGAGKMFGVRLYDADMKHISNITLTANGGEAVVGGLPGGTTYYLAEDGHESFEAMGIEIVGVTVVNGGAVGIVIPAIAHGDTLDVQFVVTNIANADNLVGMFEDEPPFGPAPPPVNPPLVNIPYEDPAFGPNLPSIPQTGEPLFLINMLLFAVSFAGIAVMARMDRKSRKS